jgi:hypothetical protein
MMLQEWIYFPILCVNSLLKITKPLQVIPTITLACLPSKWYEGIHGHVETMDRQMEESEEESVKEEPKEEE